MLARPRATVGPGPNGTVGTPSVMPRSTRKSTGGASLHPAASNLLVALAAPLAPAGRFDSPFKQRQKNNRARLEQMRQKVHALNMVEGGADAADKENAAELQFPTLSSPHPSPSEDESDRAWAELNKEPTCITPLKASPVSVRKARVSDVVFDVQIVPSAASSSSLLTPAAAHLSSAVSTRQRRRRRSSTRGSALKSLAPVEMVEDEFEQEEFGGQILDSPAEDEDAEAEEECARPTASLTPTSFMRSRKSTARRSMHPIGLSSPMATTAREEDDAEELAAWMRTRRSDRRSLHQNQLKLLQQMVREGQQQDEDEVEEATESQAEIDVEQEEHKQPENAAEEAVTEEVESADASADVAAIEEPILAPLVEQADSTPLLVFAPADPMPVAVAEEELLPATTTAAATVAVEEEPVQIEATVVAAAATVATPRASPKSARKTRKSVAAAATPIAPTPSPLASTAIVSEEAAAADQSSSSVNDPAAAPSVKFAQTTPRASSRSRKLRSSITAAAATPKHHAVVALETIPASPAAAVTADAADAADAAGEAEIETAKEEEAAPAPHAPRATPGPSTRRSTRLSRQSVSVLAAPTPGVEEAAHAAQIVPLSSTLPRATPSKSTQSSSRKKSRNSSAVVAVAVAVNEAPATLALDVVVESAAPLPVTVELEEMEAPAAVAAAATAAVEEAIVKAPLAAAAVMEDSAPVHEIASVVAPSSTPRASPKSARKAPRSTMASTPVAVAVVVATSDIVAAAAPVSNVPQSEPVQPVSAAAAPSTVSKATPVTKARRSMFDAANLSDAAAESLFTSSSTARTASTSLSLTFHGITLPSPAPRCKSAKKKTTTNSKSSILYLALATPLPEETATAPSTPLRAPLAGQITPRSNSRRRSLHMRAEEDEVEIAVVEDAAVRAENQPAAVELAVEQPVAALTQVEDEAAATHMEEADATANEVALLPADAAADDFPSVQQLHRSTPSLTPVRSRVCTPAQSLSSTPTVPLLLSAPRRRSLYVPAPSAQQAPAVDLTQIRPHTLASASSLPAASHVAVDAAESLPPHPRRSKKSLLRVLASVAPGDELPDDLLAQLFTTGSSTAATLVDTEPASTATGHTDNASVLSATQAEAVTHSTVAASPVTGGKAASRPVTPAASPVASFSFGEHDDEDVHAGDAAEITSDVVNVVLPRCDTHALVTRSRASAPSASASSFSSSSLALLPVSSPVSAAALCASLPASPMCAVADTPVVFGLPAEVASEDSQEQQCTTHSALQHSQPASSTLRSPLLILSCILLLIALAYGSLCC